MMKTRLVLIAAMTSLVISVAAQAAITVDVIPATGPNVAGSPNTADYYSNALYAIQNGLSSYQAPGTQAPSAYQTIPANDPVYFGRDLIVTGGALGATWLGYTNPGTMFGPAYASELGNRFFFGLHVLGNGTQFIPSQIDVTYVSTDAPSHLFSGDVFTPLTTTYSSHLIGIDYVDGIKGNGNDIIYTSGSINSHPIDELVYTGLSDGATALTTAQLASDLAYYYAATPFDISGSYTVETNLGDFSGSADFMVIPEPASLVLIVAGGLCMIGRRRRKD